MAERLGFPLMPWQLQIAEVGGEIDPLTGLPAYREVIVTVPRQSGKTLLILAWLIQRALGWGLAQRILYSAQTGNDARKKLVEDWSPILEPRKSRLGIHRILRGTGSEAVEFKNGSRLVLLASSEEAGHGKTVDMGVKDELFADYDDRRDQAMVPAMATKPAAQVLTMSTMGTDESLPLNRAVARGRAAVEADERTGIAYFEWSAPETADADDPDVWRACMPALGFTITESVVAHARATLADGEFRRAFLNQQTKTDNRVIPIENWVAVCSDEVAPTGMLMFSLDVNPERSAGAIVSASGGDMPTAELVAASEGTAWIVPRVLRLDERWDHPLWIIDQAGPAVSFVAELEGAGVKIHQATSRELVAACGQFYDGVMERTLRLRRNPKLDAAAAGAAKRSAGDAWKWTRRSLSADVSPLVAATLALWAHSQRIDAEAGYFSMSDLA